jgi:hypothetical protein
VEDHGCERFIDYDEEVRYRSALVHKSFGAQIIP